MTTPPNNVPGITLAPPTPLPIWNPNFTPNWNYLNLQNICWVYRKLPSTQKVIEVIQIDDDDGQDPDVIVDLVKTYKKVESVSGTLKRKIPMEEEVIPKKQPAKKPAFTIENLLEKHVASVPPQSFTTHQLQEAINFGTGPLGPFQKTLMEQWKRSVWESMIWSWMHYQNNIMMHHQNALMLRPVMTLQRAVALIITPLPSHLHLNTKRIAENLKEWLKSNRVPRILFAKAILECSADLLRKRLDEPLPWDRLARGRLIYLQMYNWLGLEEEVRRDIWNLVMKINEKSLFAPVNKRQEYTTKQKERLMEYFNKDQYPSKEKRIEIGRELNIPEPKIERFFTNRRRSPKKNKI